MSNHIKSITSEIKSLRSIFINNDIFSIPDFQRDFVWGREEINKLFDDFDEDTDSFEELTGEGYLLGNIVTIKEFKSGVSYKEVIDGQQRLTVLSLIFFCLKSLIENIREDNITKITKAEDENYTRKMIKKNEEWSGLESELDIAYSVEINNVAHLKIQHDPSLLIGEDYKSFFSNKVENSDSKIEFVYDAIDEKINSIYNDVNGENKIKKLIKFLRDEVYLIETSATSLSKAFQLFEVLNQRGVGLTPLDLIKNLLLKRLVEITDEDEEQKNHIINERRDLFGELWYEFTSKLTFEDLRRNPINSSTFLKHYLIGMQGRKITDKNLFDHFSRLEYTPKEVLSTVRNFIKILNIYREIEKKNYDSFTNDSHSKLVIKLLFESFGNKQIHSLLIPFYYHDEKLKSKVLNYAVRLVAGITYADASPSSLEKTIANGNKILYKNNDKQNLDEYFNYLQDEINELASKAKALVEVNKYENRNGNPTKKSKHLFEFIEIVAHNEDPFSQTGQRKGKKVITLEHIMPQKLDENKYKDYLLKDQLEHSNYLNRIGNLALVEQSDNSSMKNRDYKHKKSYFLENAFFTTQSISKKIPSLTKMGLKYNMISTANEYLYEEELVYGDYWDTDKIKKRSKIISEYLYYILTSLKYN